MIVRDNADDYAEGGLHFIQSWMILGEVQCPPSREVFEYGWEVAAHERRRLTPQQYAHAFSANYGRADADRIQGQPWYRWSEAEARLVPK